MTNKLIKVDRVRSVEEAAAVEERGAGLVGVEVHPDPRFDDDRTQAVEQARAIGRSLRQAKLVVTADLGDDPGRVLSVVSATGASLVQTVTTALPSQEIRAALSDVGIGIVYAGIEISHDDDPSWVFGAYSDTPDLNAALFQVDVLTEYSDSWAFLRDRSPEYPDEFQIADLNELARERPLVAGLDFTPATIGEIAEALTDVRGFALTIADRARRNDARFHTYADALAVLDAYAR
jgi:hypothetical protein